MSGTGDLTYDQLVAAHAAAQYTANLAWQIAESPEQWRLASHASGINVAFNRATSHVTLLKPGETEALLLEYAAHKV